MNLFLAEAPGDVAVFARLQATGRVHGPLVCLSNVAALEADEQGLAFTYLEALTGQGLPLSRAAWTADTALADAIQAGFGPFRAAADVEWFAFFKAVRALRGLDGQIRRVLAVPGVATIHLVLPARANFRRVLQDRIESNGAFALFLFLAGRRARRRILLWDPARTRPVGWGPVLRRFLGGIAPLWRMGIQRPTPLPVVIEAAAPVDLLLDGWGTGEIDKTLDLDETVRVLAVSGRRAGHIFYNAGWQAPGKDYRALIEHAGQTFIDGDVEIYTKQDPAALRLFLSPALAARSWRAAVRLARQFPSGRGLLLHQMLWAHSYGLIAGGLTHLDEARHFMARHPHRFYLSVAGDNRGARARILASQAQGGRAVCMLHGFNFYIEPAAMFPGDWLLVGAEGKRQQLIRESRIHPERIIVVPHPVPAHGLGLRPRQEAPRPPYRLVVLLSDTHVEWPQYPPRAFALLVEALEILFARLDADVEITCKLHPGMKFQPLGSELEQRIVAGLARRFAGRKLDFVAAPWRYGDWQGYHLAFTLDLISSTLVFSALNQVPVVYFTHPDSAQGYYIDLDPITLPITAAAALADAVIHMLHDPALYATWVRKGRDIARLFFGPGAVGDPDPGPPPGIRGLLQAVGLAEPREHVAPLSIPLDSRI